TGNGCGQLETGAGIAGAINGRFTPPDLFAIDARADGDFGSGRNAAFGAFDVQVRGNHVAGAVTIAYKNDLALETRSAVGTNIELALGRRIARGVEDAHGIFPARLICGNVP